MAYDEGVAECLREVFTDRAEVVEKKMFGGTAFMVRGNICCGVVGERLMARVGPEQHDAALARPHTRVMDFTHRPMRGFLYVDLPGFERDEDLRDWVATCERYVLSLPPK